MTDSTVPTTGGAQGPPTLADLVATSRTVAATPGRLDKVAALADLLRRVPPDEAPGAIGLLVGEPRPGRIGVGWATMSRTEVPAAATASLTLREVDDAFAELAGLDGPGSQGARADRLRHLLGRATAAERDHLIRVLGGEVRQGANAGVVADAVAKAAGVPAAEVRRAAMLLGDLGAAASRALAGDRLTDLGLTTLIGVQPMLAGTAPSVAEALLTTGPASVEWKLDGARIQVHRRGDAVRVFTRTLNEISARVPEVVAAVRGLPADDLVLDGEALGLDPDGNPLKFQDSMTAGANLQPFFFDLLARQGQSLIDEPLAVRKRALRELVPAGLRLPTLDVLDPTDARTAEQFAGSALAAGHEGVMVKSLDSVYQAGRRGATWRKVKPVYTLDLVVLAAEWGHGRRAGYLSNIHLGARDADGAFVMVGKTFKGMTDALLRWQTETFPALAVGEDSFVVHLRPEIVVEIGLDGVQRSSRYPGGVALRFARVRRYRPDKTADQADTIERVQAMV
jgi:DNA ligase-1